MTLRVTGGEVVDLWVDEIGVGFYVNTFSKNASKPKAKGLMNVLTLDPSNISKLRPSVESGKPSLFSSSLYLNRSFIGVAKIVIYSFASSNLVSIFISNSSSLRGKSSTKNSSWIASYFDDGTNFSWIEETKLWGIYLPLDDDAHSYIVFDLLKSMFGSDRDGDTLGSWFNLGAFLTRGANEAKSLIDSFLFKLFLWRSIVSTKETPSERFIV